MVRARGPCTWAIRVSHANSWGYTGTRPGQGLSPTSPLKAAGIRMEPPRSVPMPTGANPAATAAALPPLDPPGVTLRSHGLRVCPNSKFEVLMSAANSGVFDLPRMTAPASTSLSTRTASDSGTKSGESLDPKVVRNPPVSMLSFTTTGTPSSGRAGSPRPKRASHAWAAASAASLTVQIALRVGLTSSRYARNAWRTSEALPSRFAML